MICCGIATKGVIFGDGTSRCGASLQDGYVDWTRVKAHDIRLPADFDPDEGCVVAGK